MTWPSLCYRESPLQALLQILPRVAPWVLASVLTGTTNLVFVQAQLAERVQPTTLAWTLLYDFSLSLMLGTAVALALGLAVWLRGRAVERFTVSRKLRYAALTAAGAFLGGQILDRDFANAIATRGWDASPVLVGAVVGGGCVLVLGVLSEHLHNSKLRWLALGCGLALAGVNAQILVADYPGIHLFVALGALTLVKVGVTPWCQRIPSVLAGALPWLGVAVSIGVFAWPPSRVVRQGLLASPGSVVFPLVADQLAGRVNFTGRRLPIESSPWFRDRANAPAISPSSPRLLAKGSAVLLLTVDALRNDVIEKKKNDSWIPNLARIRDESLRFTRARTPCPSTLTTVSSLFSGKYYSQLYFTTVSPGTVLPTEDRSVRVPELLSAADVESVHVMALHGLAADKGVGRGFSRELRTRRDYGAAADVMRIILKEVDRWRQDPKRDFFLYSHFVDSHAPYTLGGKRATQFESYLAELELVDREIGKLLVQLKAWGLEDKVLLIVAADHGEAFGEHGLRYHARSVYEELLRIPLMFRAPFIKPGVVDSPVSLLDVSASVLDLFGAPVPGSLMGQSLVGFLQGKPTKLERLIAADSGRRKQALIFPDQIKVILDLPSYTTEVYDLKRDPKELRNLLDDPRRNVEPHIAATERFFAEHTLKVKGWKPPWRSF